MTFDERVVVLHVGSVAGTDWNSVDGHHVLCKYRGAALIRNRTPPRATIGPQAESY